MDPIFERVSIRRYTDEPVTDEQVERLLRAAMAAPTAKDQRPWEFYVVTDETTRSALAKATPWSTPAGRAPLVIVPCARTRETACPDLVQTDLAICAESVMLEATQLGLGSVIMAVSPDPERMANVTAALGLPGGLEPFCLLAIGNPAESRAQQDRYDETRVHRI
ncbi:MAG: nitroreductase family protein [Atopobiaceae bacterium]|jgi:nitroreductase|nr:nitroreductase family protein [Atopobiaceae bacterium]MCI2174183.1 nitroreductase family protein [Atopobiaceae bacterium]MCI2206824.1 nitroreductase family protein [Atopobiaceae bacterium]